MRQGKKEEKKDERKRKFKSVSSPLLRVFQTNGSSRTGKRPWATTTFFHVPLSSLHLSRSSSSFILSFKKTTSWWPRYETFFFLFRESTRIIFFLFIKFTFLKFAVAPTGRRRTSQNAASTFFNQQENGKERNVVNSGGNRHDTQPYKE